MTQSGQPGFADQEIISLGADASKKQCEAAVRQHPFLLPPPLTVSAYPRPLLSANRTSQFRLAMSGH